MFCPKCESENIRVVDTMHEPDNMTYRRRKCLNCGTNFRTVETILDDSEESRAAYRAAAYRKNGPFKGGNELG